MNPSIEKQESPLQSVVKDARLTALEQVSAVWQLQVDRVRAQLEEGWRDQLQHVLAERFNDIESVVQGMVDSQAREILERAATEGKSAARAELTAQLNQIARSLRQAEGREVWIRTLLEGAAEFCKRAALFAVVSKKLVRFEGGLAIDDAAGSEFATADSPALQNVIESRDTVVAMGTAKELSEPLHHALGLTTLAARKVYLLPLVMRKEVAGILYAEPPEGAEIDVPALELLATLAVHSMELEITPPPSKPLELIAISSASAPAPPAIPKEAQEMHARAQRFARLKVAEMLLYKVSQVKLGRANRDLYGTLKEEIDAARDFYQREFLSGGTSLADYLHAELVSSLGGNDAGALGPAYPGPIA